MFVSIGASQGRGLSRATSIQLARSQGRRGKYLQSLGRKLPSYKLFKNVHYKWELRAVTIWEAPTIFYFALVAKLPGRQWAVMSVPSKALTQSSCLES
jgi:hypothetical protein